MTEIKTVPEGIKFLLNYENKTPLAQHIAADLMGRHEFGLAKYGVALTPTNGRNTFKDIYEEYLDAYNYIINALLTKNIMVAELETTPAWGNTDKEVDALFGLLTTTIKALKIMRGNFNCN